MTERIIKISRAELEAAELQDFEPTREQFLDDVIRGLSADRKSLPCKYLYDERGSQLFDSICELDEYYPTRTEMQIMHQYGAEMADLLGPGCLLIEYGSGSSTKTPILLDQVTEPAGYVPVEISREHLLQSVDRLQKAYPDLPIQPVCADYTQPFDLPEVQQPVNRRVVYFPGSTIGNFHPYEAKDFLEQIAQVVGPGGGLLLGVDIRKTHDILEAAYNDGAGVTAAFNLNLLERINRELGADFDLDAFEHRAIYNEAQSRIEMLLFSQCEQTVHIDDHSFTFGAGESILTECSYKYGFDDFADLAAAAGFQVEQVWADEVPLFTVRYLTVT
jgi:dimethylhistidine N-methyltransferase